MTYFVVKGYFFLIKMVGFLFDDFFAVESLNPNGEKFDKGVFFWANVLMILVIYFYLSSLIQVFFQLGILE